MPTKSVLWTLLATAALTLAGCESGFTPDAHQATAQAATAPAAPARGENEGRPATAAPAARGRGGPTVPANLENAMSEMNRMLQDLKKVAADPAQAEQALKDCATFERDVAICKLLVPPQITRMTDAAAKAEALTSYRAMMTGLTKTALDLEDAINEKKPDDVKKYLAQLEETEKMGHTELKVGKD